MFIFSTLRTAAIRTGSTLVFLSLLALNSPAIRAQKPADSPGGIAWKVNGAWAAEDTPILTGDTVNPGSLLRPGDETGKHSITVFLPDGQRIFYECSTMADCARGFRVPPLYRPPEPFAISMLTRIGTILARERLNLPSSSTPHESQPARTEAVATIDPDNRVQLAGLIKDLPNGHYTYDLQPLDRATPRQVNRALEKSSPTITVAVPSPGIYILTITDELKIPRIDLFFAAVRPAQEASLKESFNKANALMGDWDGNYSGWPIHDFRRAYLESLMQDTEPTTKDRQAGAAGNAPAKVGVTEAPGDPAKGLGGVAAEPAFSPKPGAFAGDTAVTLLCDTQGATIHYTVDGSQPIASSPVYAAPIMVEGTELTIKSFASAAGKKDSAVVTGIFRIGK
jgi:hypothetical protein